MNQLFSDEEKSASSTLIAFFPISILDTIFWFRTLMLVIAFLFILSNSVQIVSICVYPFYFMKIEFLNSSLRCKDIYFCGFDFAHWKKKAVYLGLYMAQYAIQRDFIDWFLLLFCVGSWWILHILLKRSEIKPYILTYFQSNNGQF